MTCWSLPRVPEPEFMGVADEVESYSSAAAARHLNAIDDTFVEHLLRLLPASTRQADAGPPSWGLDVGTGPAAIPLKVLARVPRARIVGLDGSPAMLARARSDARGAGMLNRLELVRGDGHSLSFANGVFAFVMCNSVLHHARDPVGLLREILRVAAPNAAILVRDLRRPSRAALPWHLWRHGRHYSGLMRKLFNDSVRAAYTLEELNAFIAQCCAADLKAFHFRAAHIGIERRARE
jgi:ubiquinone/menaquinone biosynthesis C-methylase UbiE